MPTDDGATRGPIPLGPVGGYLIGNLEDLRNRSRLTYKDLSDRLGQLGRPIPTLGLSRIEKGNRRVDADDLIALAVALDVSPAELLLPPDAGPEDEVELTATLRLPARIARDWLNGRIPLPQADVITWARRPAMYVVRESEITEMRRRLDELEQLVQVGQVAQRHRNERNVATRPIPAEEGVERPIATAIVTSGRAVLVGQRRDGRPPWTFISGEVEPGESPAFAAGREVKEEATLEVEVGELIGERDHPKTGRHMYYLAATPTHSTDIFVGDTDELENVRWVTLAEADELMREYGMFGPVREHLARVLGEA
jgi:8-oxo-dGTP diphosphatase